MTRILIFILLFPFLLNAQAGKNKMELVFCTDLSGSTNGLIRQFNEDFWTILNTIPKEKTVKIGLIAYGRKSFTEKEGFTKEISPLTKRYDALTKALLKLPETTEGSDAFIDNALSRAIHESLWTADTAVQKEIVLIGNGGFRVGRMEKLLKEAKKIHINVKAVYYKTYNNSKELGVWEKSMKKLSVPFVVVTNQESNIYFNKFYDEKCLQGMGEKLKETYIYHGKEGKESYATMDSIDHYAQRLGLNVSEERILFKYSALYQGVNAHWDLVDLYDKGMLDVSLIDRNYLPEYFRDFTDEQLKNFIILKSGQRRQLLQQIGLEQATFDAHHERKQLKSELFVNGKSIGVALLQWFH